MPRWRIVREGREVGYLDAPDSMAAAAVTPLPGFEGGDIGLAVIVQLRGSPVAGIVYSWNGETIDITRPSRLSWTRSERSLPPEQSLLGFDANVDVVEPEPPGTYAFHWRIDEKRRSASSESRDVSGFALEVHDDGLLDASLRWLSLEPPVFGGGYLRASFRAGGGEARGEGEFLARLDFDRPGGEGYLRGRYTASGAESEGEFYVDLDFTTRLRRSGSAYLRFRGRYPSDEERQPFSIPWLVQKLIAGLPKETGVVPITLWIGKVSYDAAAQDLHADSALRRTLALSLMANTPLSRQDLVSVARWLDFRIGHEDLGATGPWREALQPLGRTYRTPALERTDCKFVFDASVPADKVLELLTMLAKALQRRGGGLCFGTEWEE